MPLIWNVYLLPRRSRRARDHTLTHAHTHILQLWGWLVTTLAAFQWVSAQSTSTAGCESWGHNINQMLIADSHLVKVSYIVIAQDHSNACCCCAVLQMKLFWVLDWCTVGSNFWTAPNVHRISAVLYCSGQKKRENENKTAKSADFFFLFYTV